MLDEQKISLMNYIIKHMEENVSSNDMPVLIGTLNKPTGIKGFVTAEIGHPVFEFKDRYIIYLVSDNGKTTVSVPYYKNTLTPSIDFN